MKTSKEDYNELLETWVQHCKENKIKDYFTDGPLTEQYWSEKKRILVVNLEAYGYAGCGHVKLDISMIKGWMGNLKSRTSRYTSVFINSLLYCLDTDKTPKASEIKKSYHEFDKLLEAMKKIAYINIRKTSNEIAPQNKKMIRSELETNKEFLRKQIDVLSPNIILFGGKEGCNAANKIFSLESKLKYKGHYCVNGKTLLVSVKHFARIWYGYFEKTINEIYELEKKCGG